MYAGSAIQSIEYTILFLFSFVFVLTVNLIILHEKGYYYFHISVYLEYE